MKLLKHSMDILSLCISTDILSLCMNDGTVMPQLAAAGMTCWQSLP
jgi:hypothetical protein